MKLGIALAGGGIKGSAHLGILAALEEEGIIADMYAGTSAGAIVASFKALGISNEECLEILDDMSDNFIDVAWWDIIKSLRSKFHTLDGFLKGKNLRAFLQDKTNGVMIQSTQKPLAIVACDISSGTQVIFTSGKLIDPISMDDDIRVIEACSDLHLYEMMYASAAIPGLYVPVRHKEMVLIDGSVTNNLPANALKEMGATHILAIDLVNRHESRKVKGIWDILNRSISIMIDQNMDLSVKGIENCIEMNPHIKGVGFLDFEKLKPTYEEGYLYGKYVAPTIKTLLRD